MKTQKYLALSATAVAAAIALGGCASVSNGTSAPVNSMNGMDHGSASGSAPASSTPPAAADHNAADTMFTQGMIPHHQQAVEMSDLMLGKKDVPAPVKDLATRIKATQGPEIATMTGWLKTWNESATMAPGHTMEGMMGDDDLTRLKAAQGTEAAKLFLTQMIAHHQGAVTMAKTEIADGKNADAVALAKSIVTAQESEIKDMQALLPTL
ncbi:protein of unknown function DUF305 (plasmid) [Arthrobacter sp. FB24]|uniref:DUF305 domain-containing protein n=1 Tax=Arthrobacter sp. (strain FB24) TaxID=290399 RepID=UPI0000527CA2|nr:DUF305 domain-containing protein [Arthrobacter sp. FB24]ABK05656.1 protein of unknown function DUF305 [Arthrobacter sp. FB24]